MRRIALTGGIATGKSLVAARLRTLGVPVVDADQLARQAVAPGTPGLAAVVTRFGREVLRPDGTLDRARLARLVFAEPTAREDLERIVHPEVRQHMDAFFASLPGDTPIAVAEIPLLFETGRAEAFDEVVVVACAPDLQRQRLIMRDALSPDDADRRLAAQWPIERKVERADHVIRTDGNVDETMHAVDALFARLASGSVRSDSVPSSEPSAPR